MEGLMLGRYKRSDNKNQPGHGKQEKKNQINKTQPGLSRRKKKKKSTHKKIPFEVTRVFPWSLLYGKPAAIHCLGRF